MGIHKGFDPQTQPANGDDHLSIFERKLWALTYSCLYRFGCPVTFNVYGPNYQHKLDQVITFFVPRANPMCAETIAYLHEELDRDNRQPEYIEGQDPYPGCQIHILEFEGVDFYTPYDVSMEMAQRFMEDLKQRIELVKKGNLN